MKNFSVNNLFMICLTLMFFVCKAQTQERKGFAVTVNSRFDEASMTKEEFQKAVFGVHSFYVDMGEKVKLKGFTVKYPSQKPIIVKGTKLNEEAIRGLAKVKNGDQITVYDALSECDGNYRAEIRNPMLITIK